MDKKNLISLESVVVQVADLVSSSLDEETVMMSVNSGKYYGLDEIGSRIWELIKQPRSVSDLCDILLEEFEVDRKQCEKDVLDFLNELAEKKLLRVIDGEVE